MHQKLIVTYKSTLEGRGQGHMTHLNFGASNYISGTDVAYTTVLRKFTGVYRAMHYHGT